MESKKLGARLIGLQCLCLCLGFAACGGGEPAPEQASAPLDVDRTNTFAASACGSCTATQCARVIEACQQQPGCASRWDCIESCSVSASGALDAACRNTCPLPAGAVETSVTSALTSCLDSAPCAACGPGRVPAPVSMPQPPTAAPQPEAPPAAPPRAPEADPQSPPSPPANASITAAEVLSQSCPQQTEVDACSTCELNLCCDTQ